MLAVKGVIPYFGNPNLKPETSKNFEFGTSFTNNKNFDYNITAFYSQIEDKIVSGNTEFSCNTNTTSTSGSNWSKADCENPASAGFSSYIANIDPT
jgi:outer membrane receptor for ferrienterochelin and colicins